MAWKKCKVVIPRLFQLELAEMLTWFPAVALLGPRQVGTKGESDKGGMAYLG
jgi:hypothetical protein